MSKVPSCSNEYESGFWERLRVLIGTERPFTWAARVGIPKSTFSNCMNGGQILPLKHLLKVVEVTGVSLTWLIMGEDESGLAGATVKSLSEDEVIKELILYTKKLPANKQAMVRDIIKRIAEEECRPQKADCRRSCKKKGLTNGK